MVKKMTVLLVPVIVLGAVILYAQGNAHNLTHCGAFWDSENSIPLIMNRSFAALVAWLSVCSSILLQFVINKKGR